MSISRVLVTLNCFRLHAYCSVSGSTYKFLEIFIEMFNEILVKFST